MSEAPQNYRGRVWAELRRQKRAVWGLGMVVILAVIALFADFIAGGTPIYLQVDGKSYFPLFREYAARAGLALAQSFARVFLVMMPFAWLLRGSWGADAIYAAELVANLAGGALGAFIVWRVLRAKGEDARVAIRSARHDTKDMLDAFQLDPHTTFGDEQSHGNI